MISKVWRVHGVFGKVSAGVLMLKNKQLYYITAGGVMLQTELNAIDRITTPWWRMGLGFDLHIGAEKYCFSFSRPNAAAPDIAFSMKGPMPCVREMVYCGDTSILPAELRKEKQWARAWKEKLLLG